MSEPRWSDADPRPLYRDEQRPPARRQPLPREHESLPRERGRDRRPDWAEPDPSGYDREDRAVGGRPRPAGEGTRPRWGELPGVLGVCIVIGGAAVGALVSAVTNSQPGAVLSVFLVASTVGAVLAVRPKSVYTIIPVPALAYLVTSVMAGLAVNQLGTTLTALSVNAAQWIASGFVAMIIATVIAIATTIVRWPRRKGGPRRSPAPDRGPGGRPRSPRAAGDRSQRPPGDPPRRPRDDQARRPRDDQPRRPRDDQPRRPRDDQPRRPPEPRIRSSQDREADSLATTAFPDRYREGRNG